LVCRKCTFFLLLAGDVTFLHVLFQTITLLFRKDKRLIFDREPDLLL